MEMPILGLMIPKKNAAVCNGITIVLYEMEGCNMAPKFKGFLPRFPRWAVYEMMLVFPFHTGHGFFHSIQVQSRGIYIYVKTEREREREGDREYFYWFTCIGSK